jgi:hypothetical protein
MEEARRSGFAIGVSSEENPIGFPPGAFCQRPAVPLVICFQSHTHGSFRNARTSSKRLITMSRMLKTGFLPNPLSSEQRADIPAKLIVPASVGIATVDARANHDRARANHDRARANYDRGRGNHDRATSRIDTASTTKRLQSANTGKRNCKELGPNKLESVHQNLIKSN